MISTPSKLRAKIRTLLNKIQPAKTIAEFEDAERLSKIVQYNI